MALRAMCKYSTLPTHMQMVHMQMVQGKQWMEWGVSFTSHEGDWDAYSVGVGEEHECCCRWVSKYLIYHSFIHRGVLTNWWCCGGVRGHRCRARWNTHLWMKSHSCLWLCHAQCHCQHITHQGTGKKEGVRRGRHSVPHTTKHIPHTPQIQHTHTSGLSNPNTDPNVLARAASHRSMRGIAMVDNHTHLTGQDMIEMGTKQNMMTRTKNHTHSICTILRMHKVRGGCVCLMEDVPAVSFTLA